MLCRASWAAAVNAGDHNQLTVILEWPYQQCTCRVQAGVHLEKLSMGGGGQKWNVDDFRGVTHNYVCFEKLAA